MAERYQWTVPCDFCRKPAKHHCNTCGDVLCDSCKEMHTKSKASRDHSVVLYSEKVELLSNIHIMCEHHTSKKAEYWCEKCDDVACGACVTSTHRGHDLTEIGEALRSKRKEITEEMERVKKESLGEWEEALRDTKHIGDAYIGDVGKVDKSLSDQAEKMHMTIDDILSKRRKDLQNTKDLNQASLRDQENTITQGIQNINAKIREYETLRDGTSVDLLRCKVEELRGKIPQTPNLMHSLTAPAFTTGDISEKSLSDMFGNLSLDGATQAGDMDTKVPTSGSPITGSPSNATTHLRQDSPSKSKVTPTLLSAPTVMNSFDPDYHLPYIACAGQGLAWVETGRYRLQLMDREGSVKGTINTDFDFNDIAVTPHGDVLLTDCTNTCIKSVSQSKAMSSLFKTEHTPCGICCLQSGDIIVTIGNNKKVIIYSITGKKLHELPGPFRLPWRVAENKINYDIYICDEKSYRSNGRIMVYDADYKYRYEYTGSDPGSFDPMDVCSDNVGHVLITDQDNHRVHILDKDGHFLRYLLTREQGLWYPLHIDVDSEGNAWIGENCGQVKIVKYLKM